MSVYIRCKVESGLVILESDEKLTEPKIVTLTGADTDCRQLDCTRKDGRYHITFEASSLEKWSPDTPVLYQLKAGSVTERFGFCELKTFSNTDVLLNGERCYLRGYIRGIVAHEHPNMTGGTLKDAAVKNIRQAKKYGFNLVRFHSTIPTQEFVEAADEEGLFIHMEIGFAYEYDAKGDKKGLSMDNASWKETILRYRNHPSVAIFCIGNEMHKSGHQPEVHALYALGKELAPAKLIMDNSGWGEYDRPTADIYSQHIAYYFPFKHHADMFETDNCWRINGSTYDEPLESDVENAAVKAHIRREAIPLKPVIAHEAIHYIEIPDYEALNRKFDDFCARVGEDCLKANGIRKPRYMTALPELIRRKGLEAKMPDYIKGSELFKKLAIKTYLEQLRHSRLCGFEMLQFADTLKYENKNGIVDCFDDDKYIDAGWMRSINGDAVLLARFENEVFYHDTPVNVALSISNFLPQPYIRGDLKVCVNGKEVWTGKNIALAGGLQKLADVQLRFPNSGKAEKMELAAEFTAPGQTLKNAWNFWLYPQTQIRVLPEMELNDHELEERIKAHHGEKDASLVLTDTLTDRVFKHLEDGKNVILFYHRDNPGNRYYWPGALERFKPCIWDRGSNLGGVINSEYLRRELASGRYFDLNMQALLEGKYKICLDDFPVKTEEFIFGIDKPVRDRMKGLIHGIKDFIPEDTLRNFSHLFSVKVGKGTLIVCTIVSGGQFSSPASDTFLAALLNGVKEFATEKTIGPAVLKQYLADETAKGERKEDVMNHFWEIDNKPVEDTLFWEQTGIDLSKLK